MVRRFRTIRVVSSLVFLLTVGVMIYFVRGGLAVGEVQNVRFALLYVFGAIFLALSITIVIACHVILRRLKKREDDVDHNY